jgi:hypothetical protein
MIGFKANWKKENRKKAIVYSKGFFHGAQNERERIITSLLEDAVVTTNVDVKALERIVEIVEG